MGPFRAFRDRYVASYGGVSYDLAPGVVGVDPSFLQQAPDLPGRDVLVSGEATRPQTLSLRPTWLVVKVTSLMRNALGATHDGAVVFSSFDLDDPSRADVIATLTPGDSVFLNAAVSRLPRPSVRRPFDDVAS